MTKCSSSTIRPVTCTVDPRDLRPLNADERNALYGALSLLRDVAIGEGQQPRFSGFAGEVLERVENFIGQCRDMVVDSECTRPDRDPALILRHEAERLVGCGPKAVQSFASIVAALADPSASCNRISTSDQQDNHPQNPTKGGGEL